MSNLQKRILTAIVAVPSILFILYLGGIPFFLFISGLIVLGIIEYFKLIENYDKKPNFYLTLFGSLLLAVGSYFCSFVLMTIFTFVIFMILILRLNPNDISDFIHKIGISVFPILYFGWFLSHAILLRNIGYDSNVLEYSKNEMGLQSPGFFFIVIVFACTFLNDTGAFFVGRRFGENKLSPKISPGKTIEGTIGGIFLSVVAAYVFNIFFSSPLSWEWCVLYGIVIGVSAVFGDLVESTLKRGAGVKDSGGIVPGHGGILDRFDSFFFVFPVTYYMTVLFYYLKGVSFY